MNKSISRAICGVVKITVPRFSLPLLLCSATLVVACATDKERQEGIVAKNDAIEDFIEVSELEELGAIRTRNQFNHRVITEQYVIIYDRQNTYLMTFSRRCREFSHQTEVTPDIRREGNTIRAKFDTLRGCKIHSIYKISAGQADELQVLGEITTG